MAVPSMPLAEIARLTPRQVTAFRRFAIAERERQFQTALRVQNLQGDALRTAWKRSQDAMVNAMFTPLRLPEEARRQLEEYEERKRRGDTFMQKRDKMRARQNPLNIPRRERFSIRRGKPFDVDKGI